MSYCRWSSDNWKCDLYCYEDVNGGFTTHVAGNRILGNVPKASLKMLTDGKLEDFMAAYKKQSEFLDRCKREKIGLPYDGESFNDPDLESFLMRLKHLRRTGYRFPNYVIRDIQQEIKKAKTCTSL